MNNKNIIIPSIFEVTTQGVRSYDIYSKLLAERIIFVNGEIYDDMATNIVAQLLYLEAEDKEKPIFLYIHSPGGCVHSGLQIIDTMKLIKPKVGTLVTGLAASMGAAILTSGHPGMRYALPHAQIMIHQVSAGTEGHVGDMRMSMKHTEKLNTMLMKMIADNIGMDIDQLMKEADRDKWLDSEEAKVFGSKGVIDLIMDKH